MQWRNEQIYHLRQDKPLDKESQDAYFDTVIAKLFDENNPKQVLFSYLENGVCIGYGGLVHINWIDKNAEISFLIGTINEHMFQSHWAYFLNLIETIAFDEFKFRKIYTYAFDLRPQLYSVLEQNGFIKEAILRDHYYFNNNFIDVIIHSKFNSYNLKARKANICDIQTYFNWSNEETVRKLSFNSEKIKFEDHEIWFKNQLNDQDCIMYIFYLNIDIGQVRFQKISNTDAIINVSIDKDFRGKGFGVKMINKSIVMFRESFPEIIINAYVKIENKASKIVFEKSGFKLLGSILYNNVKSYHFINV